MDKVHGKFPFTYSTHKYLHAANCFKFWLYEMYSLNTKKKSTSTALNFWYLYTVVDSNYLLNDIK